ncbi:hypothetical protein [Planctobacterium marinum]|uniref:Solute-binding protein family 3/N-terminal domain-containing protein n=1 Tax=Planctobacterium marinum TaxID=1631968 RepID=A0AA48KTZ8_9ALTE|nr:hypothetical protein MACH26_14510 [Planctobacterium marinum]
MHKLALLLTLLLLSSQPSYAEKLKVFAGITWGLHHLEDDIPKGTVTEAVVALMDATDIPYEILMMNWAQAQKQNRGTPQSLLFALARQPEREAHYSWLVPLGQLDLKIARLTSRPELQLASFNELKQYKIAAVRTLSTHKMLLKAGITESEQLLLVDSSSRLLKVIEEGLVDFVFYDAALTPAILQEFNYPADFLTPTDVKVPWQNLWLYLAANPQLDEVIKQKIIQTHERLMDSDTDYQLKISRILAKTN